MKVLVLGDSHASRGALRTAIDGAAEMELDAVFVVGDFGFWPRDTFAGREFLDAVIRVGEERQIVTYFLPGNHEDWRTYLKLTAQGDKDADGFTLCDEFGWIRAAPPVHNWVWGGVRFGSVGGAFSVDRQFRTLNKSWFREELPQPEYSERLQECDVFFTHDSPVNIAKQRGWKDVVRPSEKAESEQSHQVIHDCVTKAQPQIHVHGHWHLAYKAPTEFGLIVGLDQSSGGAWSDSRVIFDTEAKTLYTWSQFVYDPKGPGLWQLS